MAGESVYKCPLEHVLLNATDEVAWVFFAGHGIRDHRLVMHDTRRTALSGTAMGDVAQLLKQTKARSAFLVLDCCFGGGVTSRVNEDMPIPRDLHNPLEAIALQGHIVITYQSFDEPA
jgi:uncharacterized caspase-like protein